MTASQLGLQKKAREYRGGHRPAAAPPSPPPPAGAGAGAAAGGGEATRCSVERMTSLDQRLRGLGRRRRSGEAARRRAGAYAAG
jgi:hypothetical protein